MSMTSENQRRSRSYTAPTVPSACLQLVGFDGTPTYTMNESRGAFVPASRLEMKLPAVTAVGSLSNQPVRVPVVVPKLFDIFVRNLNATVRLVPSFTRTSRYSS